MAWYQGETSKFHLKPFRKIDHSNNNSLLELVQKDIRAHNCHSKALKALHLAF